jgi:putative ABC transport system permease protein
MRQAIFIAAGLALGIGLVLTVTAASGGVNDAQAGVLHSLYGVGTDLTLTQAPAQGTSERTTFGFSQELKAVKQGQVAAGSSIDINDLADGPYSALPVADLATVAAQHGVSAAVGGLALTDATVTGTVPAITAGSKASTFQSSFTTGAFSVVGVDVDHAASGPLSAATLSSGSSFGPADANADDAVVDSGYATQNALHVGSGIDVGGTTFTVIGTVAAPEGGNPPDVYIPLGKAQSIAKNGTAGMAGQINTIYVSAASAADISQIQQELESVLPKATVTDQSDLASEVTGSLTSASSLADNLGRWLSVAVLVAAFGLASLLTMAAVTRRVREFGTLKALGWRSRRIMGQVMGESIVIGIVGGGLGVGLGYAGAALIDHLAPKLTATVGSANSASAASASSGLDKGVLAALGNTAHTVSVPLTAPVTGGSILLAVLLAVAGGVIAGLLGSWRVARLRPAAALSKVG